MSSALSPQPFIAALDLVNPVSPEGGRTWLQNYESGASIALSLSLYFAACTRADRPPKKALTCYLATIGVPNV